MFLQNPVLYVIPTESVLGRLSLFPAGDRGTIPYESNTRRRSVRHWQKGTTPVHSVIRRRALATVADCGTSMSLLSHGLATHSKGDL